METRLKATKINRFGVPVQNIETVDQFYEDMGLSISRIIDVPEPNVRVAFIPVDGSTIELVQPTAPDSTVAQNVGKRGPGLHHLALEVEDIQHSLSKRGSRNPD
jgi:methylmalonyl-CoA epimerase